MSKAILTTFLLIISVFTFAQSKVTGRIMGKDNKPLEYAEIILSTLDSIAKSATLSNENGMFIFDHIENGNYELRVRYYSNEIHLQAIELRGNLDLGSISVDADLLLGEVIVKYKKSLVEKKVDRLVFNVDNSIAATGGDGLDALKLTPRVKVQNDQISIIGKGGIAVMINDRIVQMSGVELINHLKSLSANDIKRIELISNPPAKYSAEGNSGLINIVTKKSRNDAWNASLRSSYKQATYATGTVGSSFNMQKDKIQLSSNVNYTNGSILSLENIETNYPNIIMNQSYRRHNFSNYLSLNTQLEYKINKHLSTGISYSFVNDKPHMNTMDNNKMLNPVTNKLDSVAVTPGKQMNAKKNHTFNYHFIYKIDSLGRKLSLDFDCFNFVDNQNGDIRSQRFSPNEQPVAKSLEEYRVYGTQDISNYSLNIEMVHPIQWVNLNYGGRAVFTQSKNNYNFYSIENNAEILDSNVSNTFNYKENTQAVYLSMHKKFSSQLEAKVGLRYELTQTEGYSKTIDSINVSSYSKLFPTAYVFYNINENNSLSLNYGRRIKRPSFWYMNPFRNIINPYAYSEGNPLLKPEFTDNIEFEYSFKNNIITNIYYSRTNDAFSRLSVLNPGTNITRITPLNFLEKYSFGLYQSLMFNFTEWWRITSSVEFFYLDSKSNIPETSPSLSGWNGIYRFSSDFNLNSSKTLLLNLDFNYYTKGITGPYRAASVHQTNASVKCLLLDKKLTISAYANDIFKTAEDRFYSYSNNVKQSIRTYYDQQYIRLGVMYNFGKSFHINKSSSKNKEERNRL